MLSHEVLHAISGREGTLLLPDTSFYDLLHMGAVESSTVGCCGLADLAKVICWPKVLSPDLLRGSLLWSFTAHKELICWL